VTRPICLVTWCVAINDEDRSYTSSQAATGGIDVWISVGAVGLRSVTIGAWDHLVAASANVPSGAPVGVDADRSL
jgi:hypothetical protein